MRSILLLLGLAMLSSPTFAQADSTLLTFFYAKNGEVFVANSFTENDTSYALQESHLGDITLKKTEVSRTSSVYKHQWIRLELTDQSIYIGKLEDVTASKYFVKTKIAGDIELERMAVTSLVPIDTRMTFSNPNKTRYFFGPSAIPMDKGEGYYQNAYLLMNSVNFGLSNHFSMGGGVVIPMFFFVTPKLSYKIGQNLHAGVGVLAGSTFIPGAILSGALPYGVLTVGTEEHNITLGSGWGWVWMWDDEETVTNNLPITTVNGMFRLSKRLQLISENWVIPYNREREIFEGVTKDANGDPVENYSYQYSDEAALAFSAGLRVLAGDRASFDIAAVYIGMTGENGIVVPYLDFVYKF